VAPRVKTQRNDQDRSPNTVDVHVGARIRARRRELHVSQERLAEALGLTFQQVQKYEKASNRVSASKLFEIAAALKTSTAYFFDGLPADGAQSGFAEEGGEFVHDFIMTPEGLELAAWFPKVKSRRQRRRILELVKSMAEEDEDGAETQGSRR
jgi:transcriptional regulator with XRE-family HTH domain